MPLRVERCSTDVHDCHSERNVVQRHSTPTKQGPRSDSARSGWTLKAIFKPSRLLVGQRARETGRKLLGVPLRALAAVNGPAAARTIFLGSCIQSAGAEPTRGGRMHRPGLTVANSFANGRKCLTELIFPLHWHKLLALGSSAWRTMPHTGSRGLDSSRSLLSELKRCFLLWRDIA